MPVEPLYQLHGLLPRKADWMVSLYANYDKSWQYGGPPMLSRPMPPREVRAIQKEHRVRIYAIVDHDAAGVILSSNSFQAAVNAGLWSLPDLICFYFSITLAIHDCGWTLFGSGCGK